MFGFFPFAVDTFAGYGPVPVEVNVTGVSATGSIGTVTFQAAANVTLTGVQATGYITSVLVWGIIDANQTPNWVQVNDSQTVTWVQVNDGNTVTWVAIPT